MATECRCCSDAAKDRRALSRQQVDGLRVGGRCSGSGSAACYEVLRPVSWAMGCGRGGPGDRGGTVHGTTGGRRLRRSVGPCGGPFASAWWRSGGGDGGRSGLAAALDVLVDPATRGDPMSALSLTLNTRNLADASTADGHRVSDQTVGRLLKPAGNSLQGNANNRAVESVVAGAGDGVLLDRDGAVLRGLL